MIYIFFLFQTNMLLGFIQTGDNQIQKRQNIQPPLKAQKPEDKHTVKVGIVFITHKEFKKIERRRRR